MFFFVKLNFYLKNFKPKHLNFYIKYLNYMSFTWNFFLKNYPSSTDSWSVLAEIPFAHSLSSPMDYHSNQCPLGTPITPLGMSLVVLVSTTATITTTTSNLIRF